MEAARSTNVAVAVAEGAGLVDGHSLRLAPDAVSCEVLVK